MKSFYHKPTLTRGAFGALVFLFVISMAKGYAMSFLKNPEEEIVLSSPFEGVITLRNKPVEGAKVVRLLTWFETQTNTDSAVTDKHGKFSLPAVSKKLTLNKISEFVISQEFSVIYQEKEYRIWVKAKWDKGLYGELGGKPENFSCELTDEFKLVENAGKGMLGTACKWSNIKGGT